MADHILKSDLLLGHVEAYDLPTCFYWNLRYKTRFGGLSLMIYQFEFMIYHVEAYDLPIFAKLQKLAF